MGIIIVPAMKQGTELVALGLVLRLAGTTWPPREGVLIYFKVIFVTLTLFGAISSLVSRIKAIHTNKAVSVFLKQALLHLTL